jgi:S1-C subfamily serine protease
MFPSPIIESVKNVWCATKEELVMEARSYLASVVGRVDVIYSNGEYGHGSCFFYSQKFYLLTCKHVVENATDIQVSNSYVLSSATNNNWSIVTP